MHLHRFNRAFLLKIHFALHFRSAISGVNQSKLPNRG